MVKHIIPTKHMKELATPPLTLLSKANKCRSFYSLNLNILPFLLWLTLWSVTIIHANAQDVYQVNTVNNDAGDAHFQVFPNGDYWLIQALASGAPVTGHPIIRISVFDPCGPVEAFEFTHPSIYGVLSFNHSFIDGDTLRIVMHVNPRDLYHHSEVGLLSIHRQTFGHRYQYVRADNVIYPRAFIPVDEDHYLLHAFLSYTDRPTQYGTFLMDKDFQIEAYYENFNEGTGTGGVVQVPGGFIVATSRNIYMLDQNLQALWRKEMDQTYYFGNFLKQADGVIMYAAQPSTPREISLIKIDFDGNILWQSDNFNFNTMKYRRFRLAQSEDGLLKFAVYKFESGNFFTDQLVIFTVDAANGNAVSAKSTFNHPLANAIQLKHFSIDPNKQEKLLLQTEDHQHLLWTSVADTDCDLLTESLTLSAASPLNPLSSNMPASIPDFVWTGSYDWVPSSAVPDATMICDNTPPLKDLLPADTVECIEKGPLYLDVSDVPYDIIWENGSTDKRRLIEQPGIYQYAIDHCDILFDESIFVDLKSCRCQFYIPNAFSPNDDGANDYFKLYNSCEYLINFECSIFDRWGGLVFQTNDPHFKWDGQFNQQLVTPGTYTYFVQYQDQFGKEPIKQEGSINVLY